MLMLVSGCLSCGASGSSDQGTATTMPTAAPSVTATPGPGTTTGDNTTATATPSATPTATPTATPIVTATPTATPSADPYLAPGWPYYGKRYGPAAGTGTITVQVESDEGPVAERQVGVVAGSYGSARGIIEIPMVTMPEFTKLGKPKTYDIPLPATWQYTGFEGSASLGEFPYGSYTVYHMLREYEGEYYCEWQTIVIDDSHRDWVVTFEYIMPR